MALRRALPSKVGSSSVGEGICARLGKGASVVCGDAAAAKSRSLPGLVVATKRFILVLIYLVGSDGWGRTSNCNSRSPSGMTTRKATATATANATAKAKANATANANAMLMRGLLVIALCGSGRRLRLRRGGLRRWR